MSVDHFPSNVLDHLGWYVYRLVDPRDDQTFYIGKGQGDRIFVHAKGLQLETNDDDVLPLKLATIADIHRSHHTVKHWIHRHGIPDQATAYLVEAALIDAYPALTNLVGGHGASKYGCRTVDQLIELYAIDEASFEHNVILIDISRSFNRKKPTRKDLYEAVRLMWVLKKEKAEKYDLVLPHRGGVILGVFRPTRWMLATIANFKEHAAMIEKHLASGRPERIGFEGHEETDLKIVQLYERKRVPDKYRTAPQQPCRYVDASPQG